MNREFISIKEIASEVYSHRLLADLPFERIIADTLSLTRIVGCPVLFKDKEDTLVIKDYRALLPCDYYEMNQVLLEPQQRDTRLHAFKYSTSTFSPVGSPKGSDLVYKIQGNIIYTSIEEGEIRISYQAIAIDDDGYPLIINNESYKRALVSYIKWRRFTDLFDEGEIRGDILKNAEQDYHFNIAQATNSMKMPSLDEMESISRIFTSLLDRPYEHNNAFRDLNKTHTLKKHNG